MKRITTYLLLSLLLLPLTTAAQTAEWKLIHKGNQYFKSEQYDKAEQCYLNALKRNPKNARATFNLGNTYLAKKDAEAALKQYEAAAKLEQNPEMRALSHYNMGIISQTAALQAEEQQKQQLLREAIGHYKNALRNNPKDDNARYNLALCQKQLKDSEQNQQQQKQDKQQQQQQEKQKEQQQQQQNKQQEQNKNQEQQNDMQTQQLLNLSRQAEERAKQKVNQAHPRRGSLKKNW